MGNMFQSLFDMAKGLIQVMGVVWQWLSSPIKVDIPFLSDIAVIGSWFEFEMKYSPIELLGVGISLLLILWVVKHLIPLG